MNERGASHGERGDLREGQFRPKLSELPPLERTGWGPTSLRPIDHDPVLAGKKAVEFVRLAFVRQNDENAYALLSDNTRRNVPLDKFKETLSRLRPSTRPSKITA